MTMEDELAIHRTLAAYCHRIDAGDFTGVAELFTPDGSFAFGGQIATGREALARWFEESQPPHRRGKHVGINPIVDGDGNRASVVSDFLFVRWIKGVLMVETAGRYRDACVRIDGQWRIERRDCEMLTPSSG